MLTDDALLFAIEADYVCGVMRGDCDDCPLDLGDYDCIGTLASSGARSVNFRDWRALATARGIDLTHLEEGL